MSVASIVQSTFVHAFEGTLAYILDRSRQVEFTLAFAIACYIEESIVSNMFQKFCSVARVTKMTEATVCHMENSLITN